MNIENSFWMFSKLYSKQKESAINKRLVDIHNFTQLEINDLFNRCDNDIEIVEDEIIYMERDKNIAA